MSIASILVLVLFALVIVTVLVPPETKGLRVAVGLCILLVLLVVLLDLFGVVQLPLRGR